MFIWVLNEARECSILIKSSLSALAIIFWGVLTASTSGVLAASEEDSCDTARGAKRFAKCTACHLNDDSGEHSTGPNLFGVVGSKVERKSGYPYTGALGKYFSIWTPESLHQFLADPMSTAPGTAMAFSGLKKAEDREAVICFLSATSK